MKCFNHNNVDAVGICASCGKALCSSCLVAGSPECACSTECADFSLERRRQFALMSRRHRTSQLASEIACYSLGIIFVVVGLLLGVSLTWFMTAWAVPPGIALIVMGFFYRRSRRLDPKERASINSVQPTRASARG
jgi:hypothetical protein